MTAPVSALYVDPWHGQRRAAPATATVHCLWVQMALNANTLPALGWATMIGLPLASVTATAPPTGTLLSATKALPGGAEPPDDAAAAADDTAAGAPAVVLELPQAASVRAPAPRPAATNTLRRVGFTRSPGVGAASASCSVAVGGSVAAWTSVTSSVLFLVMVFTTRRRWNWFSERRLNQSTAGVVFFDEHGSRCGRESRTESSHPAPEDMMVSTAPTTGRALPSPANRASRRSAIGRGLAAAGVLMSADVHLALYFDGFRDVKMIGPAFLVNAAGGFVIGLLLLLWRHPLSLLAAAGFGVATLAAFYVSATVGLFGVHETFGGNQVVVAELSEWVAIVGTAVAFRGERRRA